MKLAYIKKRFHGKSLDRIERINEIISTYDAQGFDLTVRQVFYQMVSRNFMENTETNYNNLSSLISDARLAGLIDWDAITDRTRYVRCADHWRSPKEMLSTARDGYAMDLWRGQPFYVEVWTEKDALVDVVGHACRPLDTPYFSCRGYSSQSEMWAAAQRFIEQDYREGRFVIYLGDHDPSGIDMTRDIQDRLFMFGADVHVVRIALTMEQVNTYNLPPNPAKPDDKRFAAYAKKYGMECWELDALEPQTLAGLITDAVLSLRDDDTYQAALEIEERGRAELQLIHDNFSSVIDFLKHK